MSVLEYTYEKLKKRKMHFTLIDPAKQSIEKTVEIVKELEKIGTDAIMVGGSTNITPELMDEHIKEIKENIKIPVIIFPNGVQSISKYADAIYFMSMLNSMERDYLIGNQVKGARIIKNYKLEAIPMGYIVVEPGMTVGKVGKAILVKRNDIDLAVSYALAAQFFGMKLVYFEAGSGAPETVPPEMVREVKKEINIPLIVGGGITSSEKAGPILNAGADIIVTGTLVERFTDYRERIGNIIDLLRGGVNETGGISQHLR